MKDFKYHDHQSMTDPSFDVLSWTICPTAQRNHPYSGTFLRIDFLAAPPLKIGCFDHFGTQCSQHNPQDENNKTTIQG
jgi:hypothetical protein